MVNGHITRTPPGGEGKRWRCHSQGRLEPGTSESRSWILWPQHYSRGICILYCTWYRSFRLWHHISCSVHQSKYYSIMSCTMYYAILYANLNSNETRSRNQLQTIESNQCVPSRSLYLASLGCPVWLWNQIAVVYHSEPWMVVTSAWALSPPPPPARSSGYHSIILRSR